MNVIVLLVFLQHARGQSESGGIVFKRLLFCNHRVICDEIFSIDGKDNIVDEYVKTITKI